jgi:DNA-binding CsgD family transcriptional regulator
MSMARGSLMVPASRPDGHSRIRQQTAPERGAPWDDRARSTRPGMPRNQVAVRLAAVEMRSMLHEAALMAEKAAVQARSLAALLDDVVAGVSDLAPVADDADCAGVGIWPEAPALTPRESEVLVFVAEGRTNKAIAEALFVSPNTIKTHVASLLTKLHADTRAQLAAIAVREDRRGPCRSRRSISDSQPIISGRW